MNDNIDKNEIRKSIDRLQKEHPAHFTFDVTLFDNGTDFTEIQRAIDMVAKKCQNDAEINIICEMAKLYLEGVRPMVKPKHGEWTCNGNDLEYICSVCGEVLPYSDEYDYETDFCPNCGASMSANDEQVTGKLKEGDHE